MTKRQKLDFNSDELTQHLKTSKGQGMNAFFSAPSPTPSKQTKEARKVEKGQAPKRARTYKRTKPSTPASTPTRTDAQVHARTIEQLKRAILNKKHLSSFTFRFKAEELEALDQVTETINEKIEPKISKNDVIRLSLKWLLEDYEQNKQASVLARVLASV